MEYSLNFNKINLQGIAKTIFKLIAPQSEANNFRKSGKNSKKRGNPNFCKNGGNPYYKKDNSGDNSTLFEPIKSTIQDNSPPNLNNNLNVNNNVNDNENVNENVNENENENENENLKCQNTLSPNQSKPSNLMNFYKYLEQTEKEKQRHRQTGKQSQIPQTTSQASNPSNPPPDVWCSDQNNYVYTFQEIQDYYEQMTYFFPNLQEKFGANKSRGWSLDKWKRQMQAWEIDFQKSQRIALVGQNKQKPESNLEKLKREILEADRKNKSFIVINDAQENL
jgi:hypothetical protein